MNATEFLRAENAAFFQIRDVLDRGAEWVIGAEDYLRNRRHLAQGRHGSRVRSLRGVVEKLRGFREKTFGKHRGVLRSLCQIDQSLDKEWHRAAGMREDDSNIGIT